MASCSRRALTVLSGLAAVAQASAAEEAAPKRLRIKNGCMREPIWIAHEAGPHIGADEQNNKIEPGHVFHFSTPAGLMATRYWPKMGCNEEGGECTLGGSGGPGESCVRRPPEVPEDDYSRCAPPVDTKFEASFNSDGFDFVDMSLVDGWTLPFTLKLSGGECTGQTGTHASLTIDCSGLSFEHCPKAEKLTAAGITVDLRAINPATGEVAGCHAPCQKLVSDKWNNTASKGQGGSVRRYDSPEVAPYCCPTPPETPEQCRSGPITKTGFLDAVHTKCPGVYGYAYDDGMGLLKCTPQSVYDLTFFCPDARTSFPSTTTMLPTTTTKAPAATASQAGEELFTDTSQGAAPPWSVPAGDQPAAPPAADKEQQVAAALRHRPGTKSPDEKEALDKALKKKDGKKRVRNDLSEGGEELLMAKADSAPPLISLLQATITQQPVARFALVGAVAVAALLAGFSGLAARRAARREDELELELTATPEMLAATVQDSQTSQSELNTLL